jgi:hypothetical protein
VASTTTPPSELELEPNGGVTQEDEKTQKDEEEAKRWKIYKRRR